MYGQPRVMAQVWKSEGSLQKLGFSFTMWVLGIKLRLLGLAPNTFTHWSISLAPDRVVWKLRLGLNSLCNPSCLQTCSPPRQVIFKPVLLIRKVRQGERKVHACYLVLHSAGSASKPLRDPPWILLEMGSERDLTKAKSRRPAFHPSTGILKGIGGKWLHLLKRPFVICQRERLQVRGGRPRAEQQRGVQRSSRQAEPDQKPLIIVKSKQAVWSSCLIAPR